MDGMTADLRHGDALDTLSTLPSGSVRCCITSPPYFGLRDYGVDGQLGLEATPHEYIQNLVAVMRQVKRVLADDGTLWLNLGDSYAANRGYQVPDSKHRDVGNSKSSKVPEGYKAKDLLGIPWRVAFALQDDGWYLRQDIIWHKPNPMPESVRDRCTKSHEYLFLLSKSERYYFDSGAMQEPAEGGVPGNRTHKHTTAYEAGDDHYRTKAGLVAYSFKRRTATTPPPGQPTQHRLDREDIAYVGTRNKRSVWTVATQPFSEAHFATFPPELIRPCVLAGSQPGDTILDPFNGAGTTGLVALQHDRQYVGIDVNSDYLDITRRRLAPLLAQPRLLEAIA